MTTRQAVWPRVLIDRRAAAVAAQAELRAAERAARASPDPGTAAAAQVTRLRAAISALPCPHWDMQLDPTHGSEWICESCGDAITAEWVPLDEQEAHLRRLKVRPLVSLTRP